MQPHIMLWSTILGYMLIVVTLSVITSLWIRFHLKQIHKGSYCKILTHGAYCTLTERQLIAHDA